MAFLDRRCNFPKFRAYLREQLQQVVGNEKVWKAFLKWSGHGVSSEIAALAAQLAVRGSAVDGFGPRVKVARLANANGKFCSKDPQSIYINYALVAHFERESGSACGSVATLAIESTCLHELVHLLNYQHHKKTRFEDLNRREMGKAFERDAYDQYIASIGPRGWWVQQPASCQL